MKTKIEWADESWNVVHGCSKQFAGCANCYAERFARRLAGRHSYPAAPHHFDVICRLDLLNDPYHWQNPRLVMVPSMGDLFHKDVPDHFIDKVIETIARTPRHTYLMLTKRIDRANSYFARRYQANFPDLYNLWLGVSVWGQMSANNFISKLGAVQGIGGRFVSYEPALGPVDFRPFMVMLKGKIPGDKVIIKKMLLFDWLICGRERGPGARPFDVQWALDARDHARELGIPFFMKPAGKMFEPYPEDLASCKEFPDFQMLPGAGKWGIR